MTHHTHSHTQLGYTTASNYSRNVRLLWTTSRLLHQDFLANPESWTRMHWLRLHGPNCRYDRNSRLGLIWCTAHSLVLSLWVSGHPASPDALDGLRWSQMISDGQANTSFLVPNNFQFNYYKLFACSASKESLQTKTNAPTHSHWPGKPQELPLNPGACIEGHSVKQGSLEMSLLSNKPAFLTAAGNCSQIDRWILVPLLTPS